MSTEPPRRQTLGPKQRRSSVLAHPKTHAPLKASQTRSGEREKIRRARETRKHRPVVCSRTIRHSTHAPFRAAHALWGASGKGGPLLGGKRTILRMVPLSPPCGVGGRFFLPTFFLDLFRFIACRPSSNPSRRERKFLPSNLAEPRGFWGWGSRRKRFGSCCGGLRVVHRCVVCWSCCFLGRLLACTGCHFQKPVFVAVLFSLSFEHFTP